MNARPELTGVCFETATPAQLSDITRLLAEAGLPADDLTPANLSSFDLVLDCEGRVVGMAGLDVSGRDALLRSLAVAKDWRGKGLGDHLVARREAAARVAGVSTIYLLTTTAGDFFRRLGYVDTSREIVPAAVAAHAQFRSLCPASAKCMAKHL